MKVTDSQQYDQQMDTNSDHSDLGDVIIDEEEYFLLPGEVWNEDAGIILPGDGCEENVGFVSSPLMAYDINLSGTEILSLPEGLWVGGSLNLSHTKITTLPKGMKVDGSLNLSHTEISSLPEDLQVDGSLYMKHTNIWRSGMAGRLRTSTSFSPTEVRSFWARSFAFPAETPDIRMGYMTFSRMVNWGNRLNA